MNGWTLNDDQINYMDAHRVEILEAYMREDVETLNALEASDAYREAFYTMSFDEAFDRYETAHERRVLHSLGYRVTDLNDNAVGLRVRTFQSWKVEHVDGKFTDWCADEDEAWDSALEDAQARGLLPPVGANDEA